MGTLQGRARGRVVDLAIEPDGTLTDALGEVYSPEEVLHPAYHPTRGLEPQAAPVVAAAGRPMTPVQVTVRRQNLRNQRHEVHEAVSDDGQWRYRRAEHTGTLWDVEHVPTGLVRSGVPSLPKARAWTAREGAAEALLAKHRDKLKRYEQWDRETPGRPDLVAEIQRLRGIPGLVAQASAEEDEEPTEEDGPTHAGVALVAADTGRVLMLQRSYADEDDPARGCWELPGGGIEDGETPEDGARREWTEEIGQEFPDSAELRSTWDSPNGVYRGHVFVVPGEDAVGLQDGRVVPNPDDPGGDHPEQAAWWEIEHAKDNPALRPEVADTPWEELQVDGDESGGGEPHEASLWDALASSSRWPSAAEGVPHVVVPPHVYEDARRTASHFGDLDVVADAHGAPNTGVDDAVFHAGWQDGLRHGREGLPPDHSGFNGSNPGLDDAWSQIDGQRLFWQPQDGQAERYERGYDAGHAVGSGLAPHRSLAAQFGDLDGDVNDDPEHALPVTYGEDEDAPVVARRATAAAGLTAAIQSLRSGPLEPATRDEMRAGIPVIASCGCVLAGSNSSARGCDVAPAGVVHPSVVVRHLADVRQLGAFRKAADSDLGDVYARRRAAAQQPAADPYAHLLDGPGGGGDEQQVAALAFLGQRTALRDFTPSERKQVIDEGPGVLARNADRMDLTGTHYSLMPGEDDGDDDLTGWL